jgi:hypothetical protein
MLPVPEADQVPAAKQAIGNRTRRAPPSMRKPNPDPEFWWEQWARELDWFED